MTHLLLSGVCVWNLGNERFHPAQFCSWINWIKHHSLKPLWEEMRMWGRGRMRRCWPPPWCFVGWRLYPVRRGILPGLCDALLLRFIRWEGYSAMRGANLTLEKEQQSGVGVSACWHTDGCRRVRVVGSQLLGPKGKPWVLWASYVPVIHQSSIMNRSNNKMVRSQD